MPVHPLTDAERQQVSDAVAVAEARSAGEIVTIIAERSDGYSDIALAWCTLVGMLALLALTIVPDLYLAAYERLSGGWMYEWTPRSLFGVALIVFTLKFGTIWLMQLWTPFRLFLVPGPVKHERVRARAVTCFKVGAERRTHGRTGVLIYLSMQEHRAEIVADKAIASRVSPEVWGDAMIGLIAHIRNGDVAQGMCVAVEKVGAVLAQHFPRAADDHNELPDRVIEV